jgi:hypothetical protein
MSETNVPGGGISAPGVATQKGDSMAQVDSTHPDGACDYPTFLRRKAQYGAEFGFAPHWMPDFLFDFQQALVDWAIRKGRAAIFADCGLGKTPMQLVWAQNVVEETHRPVLILTPLAVSHQTLADARKFGITAARSSTGEQSAPITITNYERLHYFNPADFGGVVCDESSILKSFDGATRRALTEFMRVVPYRLLCTATAAPNDYTELGTSSEALGYLGYRDMLTRFFRTDQHQTAGGLTRGEAVRWRFKGHAEIPFWQWVCSWARAVRKPSDVGFTDDDFVLPPLCETEHTVIARQLRAGALFALPAVGLREQREERRRTLQERCETIAGLVADTGRPALVWCHLNDEADLIEHLVPDALQVAGKHSDEVKEERFIAFARKDLRVLVTKPAIGAWGLNWQHCAHIAMFPSHSYEQYYQGIRRCWRFGQRDPVRVEIVTTEGEIEVLKNLQRKAAAVDRMFSNLVAEMNRAVTIDSRRSFTKTEEIPSWL